MTQIPLLVREKVQFYYYWDQWHQRITNLHKEYMKKVIIQDSFGEIFLLWVMKDPKYASIIRCLYTENIYVAKSEDDTYIGPRCGYIKNFIVNKAASEEIPKKYCYSSGLNNPKGYTLSKRQKLLIKYEEEYNNRLW